MEEENNHYARLAYEAYCATTGGKSAISGAPLPKYHEQSDLIRLAWINGARAVRELPPLDKLP